MNECRVARRGARSVRLLFLSTSSFYSMFLPAITQQLDDACRCIAAGRAAARDLSALVKSSGLKEVEFRLLWVLLTDDTQINQTQIADRLGCSPAQVSGIVDRQRSQGNIARRAAVGDRRRQVWRITLQGCALLESVVAAKTESMPVPVLRRDAA